MKNTDRIYSVIIGVLVLFAAATISAQDWPQWRGMNRDGKVTGFKAPETWPSGLTQKWIVNVGSGDATPALKDDKIYVFTRQGADEVMQCLDARNGKVIWLDKYAAQAVTGPAASHPGPRSTPVVSDGKVITLGVGGVLSCLDENTGKIIWRYEAFSGSVPDFFTSMSPIIVDSMCIIHLGGKDNGTIVSLDLITGKEIWKLSSDAPAYGSPVLMFVGGKKQVVLLSERNLVGIGVNDGKLLWQVAAPNERMFFSCATPVIEGDKVYYTGQGHGTKAVQIVKDGDNFIVKTLWGNDDQGTTFNTPVLKDGFLYGISKLGFIFCINAQTGQTAWVDTKRLDRFGSIIDAGSVLMTLSAGSELIVFNPDSKTYTELARYKVAETPVMAHPVVADKRIYIKDSEKLSMWVIE